MIFLQQSILVILVDNNRAIAVHYLVLAILRHFIFTADYTVIKRI